MKHHTWIEQRLASWQIWHRAGTRPGPPSVISWWGPLIYDRNMPRTPNPERALIIVDPTEAIKTDWAINRLPKRLKNVVIEEWIKGGTIMQKCRALQICKQTFYNRLNLAYAEIKDTLQPRAHRRRILQAHDPERFHPLPT